MSTAENIDPSLVEQTKQQIQSLLREITRLADSDVEPTEFYDQVLSRTVTALAAIGGAVWEVNEHGTLELVYQINLRETRLAESREGQMQHGRLLNRIVASGEADIAQPHSGTLDDEDGDGNPTDFLLVLGPMICDKQVRGVLEIFQRPGVGHNAQRGYLRFVEQVCRFAGDYLKTRQLRSYDNRQTLWSQLDQFTRVVHRSLDPRETAYVLANEGRRLLECDRVSVALKRGRRFVIEAVSGQDTFDKRSTTVQLLSELATAVAATKEPMWYTGDTSDFAPQVEETVQSYVDESHSKTVAVVPLTKPPIDPTPDNPNPPPPDVIGCLVVEQIEDSRPKEGLLQRVEVVSEHGSTALNNALDHNGLFLLPVWKQLGKAKWIVEARTLPKTIAISAAVMGLIAWLCLWPAQFWLTGKGTIEPADRRDVFASIDGVVMDVKVKHGQMVEQGELLAEMRNTDLEVSISDITGQRNATQEQLYYTRRSLLDEKRISLEEKNRLNGQLAQLQKTFDSLTIQLDLLHKKKALLKVTSPIRGQVVTWDLRETLIHRPVQKGQILMTVANPSGDWKLEVNMPENRMGHIASARRDHENGSLAVEYVLATNPGRTYEGQVQEIHAHAEVRGDEGNTVLVRVKIDKDRLLADNNELRPGATVMTKINCGKAPIGYVWLHDLIAFVHTKVLFPLGSVGNW
jgi:multidrug efflux pump subunit AcrA (membrane-fusion protein)